MVGDKTRYGLVSFACGLTEAVALLAEWIETMLRGNGASFLPFSRST
jgi:hypothetical protein